MTKYGYVKREESFELFIFGRGLDALERPEYQSSVSSLHFLYVTIDSIVEKSHLLRAFSLKSLTLGHNLVTSIDQLFALMLSCNAITSLSLVCNPVCFDATMRMRLIHTYPNLQFINDIAITRKERQRSLDLLDPLAEMRAKPVDRQEDTQMAAEKLLDNAKSAAKKIAIVQARFDDCIKERLFAIWDESFGVNQR